MTEVTTQESFSPKRFVMETPPGVHPVGLNGTMENHFAQILLCEAFDKFGGFTVKAQVPNPGYYDQSRYQECTNAKIAWIHRGEITTIDF
ncbi:MAG: hypothetical protein ACT4OY_00940 [Alphaproteobacteria bacterium]